MDKYNRGNQGVFESSTGRYAKFSANLRNLLGGIADQVDQRIAPPLRRMNPNLMNVMVSFLTLKERVALLKTCKSLRKDVGRKVRVDSLLSLVAQGGQDEAEAMIEKDPSLLLERGDVTDGAGRPFRGITALQYAVWALDAHMWTMILPYFDGLSAPGSAGDQLRHLEKKGTAHGRHFDFKPLLDAYAAYLANPSEETWCRGVGGAQRLLPDHFWQEYTTSDRPFDPTPSFAVAGGRRPTAQAEWGARWWREQEYDGGRLGRTWAAVRGARPDDPSFICATTLRLRWWMPICTARLLVVVQRDRRAVQALCRQRGEELTDLLRRYGVETCPAAESKSPGRK